MLNQKRKPPMRTTITTLRAFIVVGAVVGIRSIAKMLEISGGVANRMLVRYIRTVDNTTTYKVPPLSLYGE